MNRTVLVEEELLEAMIAKRKEQGIDRYDEVWEGVYVMPSTPSSTHQDLVIAFLDVLIPIVRHEKRGRIFAGMNVSDRTDWKANFRVPDIVVVLKNGRAIDCGTYLFGGPDFLIEIESPSDDVNAKLPFYGSIGVRELLIIHRDRRTLRLFRTHADDLSMVEPAPFQGGRWLVSDVLPLAFRRKTQKGKPMTEVQRIDGKPGQWIF